MPEERCLRLVSISHAPGQLHALYVLDGLRFSSTIWYEDLDFDALGARFGRARIRDLCFHIAAFDINKLSSLKPTRIDWGAYADLATPAFRALWETIQRNVWAQWRFENDAPDYPGPKMILDAAALSPGPIRARETRGSFLCFCGGGKDSLLAMRLLEELGVEFGALSYSASCYGPARAQHELIGRLADEIQAARRHRLWIFDDFLDSPALQLRAHWGLKTLTAAETPSSIFAALPCALAHGYRYAALGHERSADAPQLVWEKTGEAINHQWGKSYEAEVLLNAYIRERLVADFDYFSILKPVHDAAIFGALMDEDAVVRTHSCNVRKPWCRRCAKCLYVWLGYTAFLDEARVRGVFGAENLYEVAENALLFRQLVGLEAQLPFECVGEADEAALFMLMARAKGYRGAAMEACAARLDALEPRRALDKYLAIDLAGANIPASIAGPLTGALTRRAAATRDYAFKTLACA